MKLSKHIILVSTVIALGVLCSANFKKQKTQELTEVINSSNSAGPLPDRKNTAFKEGEVLTYRMHYGIINAGAAILEVKPDILTVNGRSVYHIVGTGYTTGTADWFFKVRDRYETYMDKDALLPWLFVRRVDEGGYKFQQDYKFNHYTKKVDVGNDQKFDIPMGIQDMVSAFYSVRSLDLSNAKTGDIFSLDCFLDKEIWPLKIKFMGKEIIETDIGKFRCLKFRPIVQKGRVFKKEEDLNVWISDDNNHIVMRAKADVLIGSVKMDITSVKNLTNSMSRVN
ncbi:DUF3108 domain-containing protein [Aurantibacillus circumpalustris]|uniref:DUF3108 domain-containing protein n=1 Tax=Aurantibacillus circumpalustris TaxID=3036359 RepID=UPI00295A944A|nr:DUF3108 domain-containing protein [Aurantibacillus circumpalustris]